jgi:hypothetical protein
VRTYVCENCTQEYLATYPTQRWCCAECRDEYRNAELRAARKLWKQTDVELKQELRNQQV